MKNINFQNQNTMNDISSQELVDVRPSGKQNDWDGKKAKAVMLSELMQDIPTISDHVKERVEKCGSILWFGVRPDGQRKIISARLCMYRLCPICTWRRSLKTFANTAKILNYCGCEKYQYIFLTLTIRNVQGTELKAAIDAMLHGWAKLRKRKEWMRTVKGFYRGIEVTRNNNVRSQSYGTYHPHIHAILAVNKSYGHNNDYISKKAWAALWASCMELDYKPVIDVRTVKPKKDGSLIGAVCEVSKYPIKDSDYIVPDDLKFSKETIQTLDDALRGRRLVHFGGVMLEAQHALAIKDVDEDEDLIHITDEDKKTADFVLQQCYAFNYGFMRYRHIADVPYVGDKIADTSARMKVESQIKSS